MQEDVQPIQEPEDAEHIEPIEDADPEPEIALALAGDTDSDSDDLDPDMAQPVNLPTESYEADPEDDKGSHEADRPEDS